MACHTKTFSVPLPRLHRRPSLKLRKGCNCIVFGAIVDSHLPPTMYTDVTYCIAPREIQVHESLCHRAPLDSSPLMTNFPLVHPLSSAMTEPRCFKSP